MRGIHSRNSHRFFCGFKYDAELSQAPRGCNHSGQVELADPLKGDADGVRAFAEGGLIAFA